MKRSARIRLWRFIPLGIGAAAMIGGFWTGLARLGFALPGGMPALVEFHNVLMISGFLGTVIGLERAVAIGRGWPYFAPAFAAAGAVALLINERLSAWLILFSGLVLVAASALVVVRHAALFTLALAVAAGCWAIGTGLWLAGHGMAEVDGWWLTFLVLTIAAERLELSRLLAPPRASQSIFAIAAAFLMLGALRGELAGRAAPLLGIGLMVMTLWLVRYDIASTTIRSAGQARFSAVCMLAGYVWLLMAGLLLLVYPPGAEAFSFDAAVHAITIGFVFSMIFGHAPIILPAVTGLPVRFSVAAYGPLVVLHLSMLIRITGDAFDWMLARTLSGPLTVLALATYALVLIFASAGRAAGRRA